MSRRCSLEDGYPWIDATPRGVRVEWHDHICYLSRDQAEGLARDLHDAAAGSEKLRGTRPLTEAERAGR